MKQRLSYVFVLVLAAGGIAVSACSGDDDNSGDDSGGKAGASGSTTGGSSSGGSANNAGDTAGGKAGSDSGGKAGSSTAGTSTTGGTAAMAGAGGIADGGMGGVSDAGAGGSHAGAGGSDAGAGGMGEAGAPGVVYACGSATLIKRKCSAFVAANCTPATDCAECESQATSDRAGFQNDPPCDTCNAKWDAVDQCEADGGVECIPDYGADGTDACYALLDEATACEAYVATPNACPATWPL